jgi:surfeit locus 1 family protein
MTTRIALGRWDLTVPWGFAVAAALGVALFVHLGQWQWRRADEKRAFAAEFVAGSSRVEPLGSRALAALPRYTQVQVQGRYDGAHQFLLDNQSHGGQAGYDVLTPLVLDDQRTLIVNRGWVPVGANRRELPDIALDDAAPVTVTARLDALPRAALAMGHAAPAADGPWPRITSFPAGAELATALGKPIEDGQLLLSDNQPQGYARDWQPASAGFGPERHISYAVQWWGLGLLTFGLFFFMNLKRRP